MALIRGLFPRLKEHGICLRGVRSLAAHLRISNEVKAALTATPKKPVVALESAIITHGMPYPDNLRTALEVESIIRKQGAIPATIAVLSGKLCIGISKEELGHLASGKWDAFKTSRRDMPYVISKGFNGGTTVSGTMLAAHMAGITVFVTGGIGGVHRGAETSFDVSADLTELGRTPVTVVSSGVKSILDIEKTLEYLETEGVCVASFGACKDFPAFFTPRSGYEAPYNVANAVEAASLIDANLSLGLESGMLIAVPIPEHSATDGAKIDDAIQTSLHEASECGIQGREVTPYILQRVNELTKGTSLVSNIALVKNNAMIGSKIAVELTKIQSTKSPEPQGERYVSDDHELSQPINDNESTSQPGSVVVIGGTNVDFTARFQCPSVMPNGSTYQGSVKASFGGVGRNIADCITRLGISPLFFTAVGNDAYAELFRQQCSHMDLSNILEVEKQSTATYCAVLQQSGELLYGIGDFDIHSNLTPDKIKQHESKISKAELICLDGNISSESIKYVTNFCSECKIPVWFEPTDINLIKKIFVSDAWKKLTYISPNLNELRMLNSLVTGKHSGLDNASEVKGSESEILEDVFALVMPLLDFIPIILVTIGQHGVVLCSTLSDNKQFPKSSNYNQIAFGGLSLVHYASDVPGYHNCTIQSVSGAGDSFNSAVIVGVIRGLEVAECIHAGLLAARHSLLSTSAIPDSISPKLFSELSSIPVGKWAESKSLS